MSAKYDIIGKQYNRTRKADPYLAERLYEHLSPIQGGKYLDIGCGTGNYTHVFQKKGMDFIGIDPSVEMLEKAKKKNSNIDWRLGQAEKTGLEAESVDGIVGSLTTHHWSDLHLGFQELNRVLKKEGRLVIFTATPIQMEGYWLNHYFPKMLEDSMRQMPGFEDVKNAMETSGFSILETEKYFIRPDLEDLFLYSGKHKPALYFKEQVRLGISSFSALANEQEIEKGLLTLKEDTLLEK